MRLSGEDAAERRVSTKRVFSSGEQPATAIAGATRKLLERSKVPPFSGAAAAYCFDVHANQNLEELLALRWTGSS